MLRELIQLWPGGPAIMLGSYFVAFKYIFAVAFILWAVSLARWSRKAWLVTGTLVLAASSLLVFQKPLDRPYGVVANHEGLEALGEVMVVAARSTTSDGRMVGDAHATPVWGFTVAALSGFRPERLLRLYRWLPLLSLLALGLAVAWSTSSLGETDTLPAGTLSGLATFTVVFLSSHRLSFLRPEGPFWAEFFWLTPAVGLALAALCVCWRCLGATSRSSALTATIALGFAGALEPPLAVCFALGVLVWMFSNGGNVVRQGVVVVVGCAVSLLLGNWSRPVSLPTEMGSWHEGLDRIFSVTLDFGLLFLLAGYGVWLLLRTGERTERLVAWSASVALCVWVAVSFFTRLAEFFEPRLVNGYLRLCMTMCASYGAYRVLAAATKALPALPADWRFIGGFSSARLAVSGFIVLSLPWCFPFWWEPVRMDPLYVESVPAISRRFLAMGEALRSTTDADAVFATGPTYAPWIPGLTGRRVLLAGDSVADTAARELAVTTLVRSQDSDAIDTIVREWGVTHVAWGRLDQPTSEDEEIAPVDLGFFERSSLFEERYRDQRWLRVFEYIP